MCFIIYIIFNTKFYPRFSPKQAHTSFSSMKLNFVQLFLQSHSILQSTLFLTMFSKSGLLDGQSIVRISFSTLATRDVLWIIVLLQTPVLAIHLLSSRQQICLQYTGPSIIFVKQNKSGFLWRTCCPTARATFCVTFEGHPLPCARYLVVFLD